MAVGEVKIKWSKDKNGWYGMLLPIFSIYKSGKQMYLDIMEPDRKPDCENRHLEIKTVHQGKCIAAGILKMAIEQSQEADNE